VEREIYRRAFGLHRRFGARSGKTIDQRLN
jgi:hypothetical protein